MTTRIATTATAAIVPTPIPKLPEPLEPDPTVIAVVCFTDPFALSFTHSTTVYGPATAYVCVTVAPVPVDPSPNDHAYVKVPVPPLAVEVNVTTVRGFWCPKGG